MQISWKGNDSFLVVIQQQKEQVKVAINPSRQAEADITILFQEKGIAAKQSFVIASPGEYEIRGVFVQGIAPDIYTIEGEGIRVCSLGDSASWRTGKELSPDQVEKIGNIDILLAPGSSDYQNIVRQIEPRMVVDTKSIKGVEAQPKLVVKQKDLTGEETKHVVLSM